MTFTPQRPLIERGAEAIAVLTLGAAAAFAIFCLAPMAGLVLAGVASLGGIAAAGGGFAVFRGIDAVRDGQLAFDPVGFPEVLAEDELLLDDPIAPLDPNSRVVQMFRADPLPDPGELVARISDYLDSGRAATRLNTDGEPNRADASAALHAALADIRRSLR